MTEQEKKQAQKAKADYMRSWRRRNREKIKEYQNQYWLKKSREVQTK